MTGRQLSIVIAGSLLLVALILLPAGEERETSISVAVEAPESLQPVAEQEAGLTHFDQLMVHIARSDSGFTVTFDNRQAPVVLATTSIGSRIVHTVVRKERERARNLMWTAYDAVVLNPDTGEHKVYPLYETPITGSGDAFAIRRLNDQFGWFIRTAGGSGRIDYEIVRIRLDTGVQEVVASGLFAQERLASDRSGDGIVGIHERRADDGSVHQIMLTSQSGRVQMVHMNAGPYEHAWEGLYDAYLDSDDGNPQDRIDPSPDLTRFLAQTASGSEVELFDIVRAVPIASIPVGPNNAAASSRAVWNADGSMFYLMEDSGHASAGVRFYDRDGQLVRTLDFADTKSRGQVDVFGWADAESVWLARPESEKDIAYWLYQVRTGEQLSYRRAASSASLRTASAYAKGLDRETVLLADHVQRIVWESPAEAVAFGVHQGDAYVQFGTDIGGYVMRWDGKAAQWRWKASVPEYDWGNARSAPVIHNDQWLVYTRHAGTVGDSLAYVKMQDHVADSEDGLPVAPLEDTGVEAWTWWTQSDRYVQSSKPGALRVTGFSRYGEIQLKSKADEVKLLYDVQNQYHGSYSVTYTDERGVSRPLPDAGELTLSQPDEEAQMERIELDGMDILLLHTNAFLFNKGFEKDYSAVLVYAVTDQHEAYPLRIRYADASEQEETAAHWLLNDNAPVIVHEDRLLAHAGLDGQRFEVQAEVDAVHQELRIVELRNVEKEYAALYKIVSRYSHLFEQSLGLDEGLNLPEGRMDEPRLQRLILEQASANPGYRIMKREFEEERKQNPLREFAWEPIDYRFVSPDTIQVTFTLNLFYAIGQAAHMEAVLKLVDGVWRFHDFGTLMTEKLRGNVPQPELNGILVEDTLKLD
ncbi:hypothetical protein FHS18_004646 [Paenibacillus phyllosphaerae]|uniref:Uncharacterized protein n=1 Tax=Paenibacillus phyllosphaerae TaxID=274593 RepID=A0A7W5B158_9BACL|nr:hypothetical protein [Paenibacillus phyllosphaerae]MBB3112545.1 hypothetical protein [Paenibacillus phyllosphaerae]